MLDRGTLESKLNEEGRENFSNYNMCHACPWWGGWPDILPDDGEDIIDACYEGDVVTDADLEEGDRLGVVIDCEILTTKAYEKGYLANQKACLTYGGLDMT